MWSLQMGQSPRTVESQFEFSPLVLRRHFEAQRFHQRGEESRVETQILWQCTRDPLLRLKNRFARDDAIRPQECPCKVQTYTLPPHVRVDICTGKGETSGSPKWAAVVHRAAGPGWRKFRPAYFHPLVAMTKSRVSYTLDSTLETVDNAEQTASRIAMEAGFNEDEVMQISMAVREAAVNAVLHGNAYDPEKKVKLDFETTGQELVITIRDQGKGLDPSKIPDPLAPENLLKTSGRGIFLIRSFMDEVQIHPSHTGTEIKLVKHVPGSSGASKEASQ